MTHRVTWFLGSILLATACSYDTAPTAAPASRSIESAAQKWMAVGGGNTLREHFSFSAHSRVGGGSPTGYVVYKADTGTFGDFEVQGHVRCLSVVGSHAVIGIVIEKAGGTASELLHPEGGGFYLNVEDGGKTDLLSNSAFFPTPPGEADCASKSQASVKPVLDGNIVVRGG